MRAVCLPRLAEQDQVEALGGPNGRHNGSRRVVIPQIAGQQRWHVVAEQAKNLVGVLLAVSTADNAVDARRTGMPLPHVRRLPESRWERGQEVVTDRRLCHGQTVTPRG